MRRTREKQIIADDVRIENRIDIGGTQLTATAAELNTIADGITATAAELNVLDAVVAGTTSASKALVVASDKSLDTLLLDYLALGGVAASANALVLGIGASGSRATTATAGKNTVEIRAESTAASGDSRAIYNRLYLGGAGGVSGESLRTFTTVENTAAATAHGAHISLNFDATGSVTGQGIAARCTLHIPDGAVVAGTYAAVQAEIWADGSSSDISGATSHALFRGVVGGDGTGAATVANFLSLSCPAPGSNAFIDTDEGGGAAYAGLAVNIEGVGVKYIPLLSAA